MARKRKGKGRKPRSPVSKKISKLRHEGESQEQSVATALNMERAGRLTKSGGYIRAGKRKKRGHKRS